VIADILLAFHSLIEVAGSITGSSAVRAILVRARATLVREFPGVGAFPGVGVDSILRILLSIFGIVIGGNFAIGPVTGILLERDGLYVQWGFGVLVGGGVGSGGVGAGGIGGATSMNDARTVGNQPSSTYQEGPTFKLNK
jgi:hypothetical protein